MFCIQTRRAGPWEGGPRIIENVVNKPCPPCLVPLPMQCYGKHEVCSYFIFFVVVCFMKYEVIVKAVGFLFHGIYLHKK